VIRPVQLSTAAATRPLAGLPAPLPLDELVPGDGPWEVEIGFGKGRYLLDRAAAAPGRRFLGIEIAGEYERLFVGRARRRGLANWLSLRGEALYLASAVLPRGFAAAVHVYVPDPWPKARHHKRRLFDPQTVDLVLGLAAPGGGFSFATDHRDYGAVVADLLARHPAVTAARLDSWPGGPRTNYEAKYVAEGRPILRLEGTVDYRPGDGVPLHPDGAAAVRAAIAPPPGDEG
jgi:tRNA (guanine-N7-)-methyltransferase